MTGVDGGGRGGGGYYRWKGGGCGILAVATAMAEVKGLEKMEGMEEGMAACWIVLTDI